MLWIGGGGFTLANRFEFVFEVVEVFAFHSTEVGREGKDFKGGLTEAVDILILDGLLNVGVGHVGIGIFDVVGQFGDDGFDGVGFHVDDIVGGEGAEVSICHFGELLVANGIVARSSFPTAVGGFFDASNISHGVDNLFATRGKFGHGGDELGEFVFVEGFTTSDIFWSIIIPVLIHELAGAGVGGAVDAVERRTGNIVNNGAFGFFAVAIDNFAGKVFLHGDTTGFAFALHEGGGFDEHVLAKTSKAGVDIFHAKEEMS